MDGSEKKSSFFSFGSGWDDGCRSVHVANGCRAWLTVQKTTIIIINLNYKIYYRLSSHTNRIQAYSNQFIHASVVFVRDLHASNGSSNAADRRRLNEYSHSDRLPVMVWLLKFTCVMWSKCLHGRRRALCSYSRATSEQKKLALARILKKFLSIF